MRTFYWRALDWTATAWVRAAGGMPRRWEQPETPEMVHRRFEQRLAVQLMGAALLGPVGTVLGPPALLTLLMAWTAALGRCFGRDARRPEDARALRDALGTALLARWRLSRPRSGWAAMGIRTLRAVWLGQDASWAAQVMREVARRLADDVKAIGGAWRAPPEPG